MATEQAQASVPSIEERMANLFDPTPEVAQTEEETAEVQAQTEGTPEPTEQPEDDGTEELDVDGNVYKVPKELKAKVSEWKEGSLRQADYTRKTQDLADLHRQAQTAAETLQIRQQFEQEISTERNELAKVQSDIERYKQVDWTSLDVNDYVKLRGQFDTLKERAQELNTAINGKAHQVQEKISRQKEKLLQEGHTYLQRAIPNWGAEAAQTAIASAKDAGYTPAELENIYDARFVTLAWKAAQFDRLQSGKSAAVAKVQTAPPVVRPGARQTGAASEGRYKDMRAAQKKSGSIQDTARLLALRGFK